MAFALVVALGLASRAECATGYIAQTDALNVYENANGSGTVVSVAPIDAPVDAMVIVSRADFDRYAAFGLMPSSAPNGGPLHTFDVQELLPAAASFRYHAVEVLAPSAAFSEVDALAAAYGRPSTSTPTLGEVWAHDSAVEHGYPAALELAGAPSDWSAWPNGTCGDSFACPGFAPRDYTFGAANSPAAYPVGAFLADGTVKGSPPPPPPAATTVTLDADASLRLDYVWWGMWALVGLSFVSMLTPVWFRAWSMWRAS